MPEIQDLQISLPQLIQEPRTVSKAWIIANFAPVLPTARCSNGYCKLTESTRSRSSPKAQATVSPAGSVKLDFAKLTTGSSPCSPAPATGRIPHLLTLKNPISFEDIYFDSTCLKAPIHFPVDWALLCDITPTLMKATVLIRRPGLRQRIPQKPHGFLSDIIPYV